MSTTDDKIAFRGRLVAGHYPASHAAAQRTTHYRDFKDGIERARIAYGDAKDRYPGGITRATREEALERALQEFHTALQKHDQRELTFFYDIYGQGTPKQIDQRVRAKAAASEFRTDRRCPDCDVEPGELHLPGCDCERCPRCRRQLISCGCPHRDDDDAADDDEDDDNDDASNVERSP